ncbi:MAG: replication-associated recombination protein A [Candidatus Marinimicrobia bacterium]|nr:replication-associated recombination protein A [Candidatus Neomarinimicrobiota bacterium]
MGSPSLFSHNLPPLAERVRPQVMAEFTGQHALVKDHSLLIKAIESNQPFSCILWGPPGTGKTTLARILSGEFNTAYFELSAISSGVKNVREVLSKGKAAFESGQRSILFIDEIHRFSKSQQDALLHAVEDGSVILIGATTENPSFEIISPLLSRCRVLRLHPLQSGDLETILHRALKGDVLLSQRNIILNKEVAQFLVDSSGGDARKLLNTLELAVSLHQTSDMEISTEDIREALQQKNILYDKADDYHYDCISAFIKSVRGSDPDAAVYWLAVMLEGGEKPEFIARRLIILAAEDIGNAEPYALQLATAAFDAVHRIGMPEARIILSQITTYLAAVPKSNAAYQAIDKAVEKVRKEGAGNVPLHLRNAATELMKSEGYGKTYKYPHSYENHFVEQHYFPETFSNSPLFYSPENEGREKFLKERLEKLWPERYTK